MIKVTKDLDAPPPILVSGSTLKKLEEIMSAQQAAGVKSRYNHLQVKQALDKIYFNKCAFCENTITCASPQVEHYRPKGRLANDPDHPGYYWLVFEWSNLLLCCPTCNNTKRDHFPIAGQRVKAPPAMDDRRADAASMRAEQPLLLNPELDDPDEHLHFEPSGRIMARNGDIRGKVTIEVIDLNRPILIKLRAAVARNLVDRFREQLLMIIEEYADLNAFFKDYFQSPQKIVRDFRLLFSTLFREAFMDLSPSLSFCAFRKALADNFEAYVIEVLENEYERILLGLAWEEWCNGSL
ncbi:MAG: TIGR02646 family protein [Acidobacteriota bacterium]|nr:TIGR02646 family protein [Acidobacteriota bacterium]